MERIFLIVYDLRNPEQNYSELYEVIKGLGCSWAHPLESTWVIKTRNDTDSASTMYRKLKPIIDTKDSLFIVEITGRQRQGWLQKSFWEWLKND